MGRRSKSLHEFAKSPQGQTSNKLHARDYVLLKSWPVIHANVTTTLYETSIVSILERCTFDTGDRRTMV